MKKSQYKMEEKLFLWPSEQVSWYFLPITKAVGREIKDRYGMNARGFGSLPVSVTIGNTVWRTSIFPDRSSGSYILPVKASVRKQEDLFLNDSVRFTIMVESG